MEVIVDDSQLSLAIGKKGQNVRLAAKLLGWKIDIKSEEEKRQEVESQMAALVQPGAPVSVLIDYGLPDKLAEKLLEAGIGSIEKLGAMTPEQLEEIQGIDPTMVEQIQVAVNTYYSQFEVQDEAPAAVEEAPAAQEEAADAAEIAPEEVEIAAAEEAVEEPESPEVAEGGEAAAGEAEGEPEAGPAGTKSAESESDTIEDSGQTAEK
jgi:N utilization substance protein A